MNKKTVLFIWIIFIHNALFSQVHKKITIRDLATHGINVDESIRRVDWNVFYPEIKDGMDRLKADIENNPEKYPLQELESEDKQETDDFRRWEYQMRRMPVEIVAPITHFVNVKFDLPHKITFCQTNSFDLKITIKNISKFDLPPFYFSYESIDGTFYDKRKSVIPSELTFSRNGNVINFKNGLKKSESVSLAIHYIVGCDGRGSSPVLKGKDQMEDVIRWKLNLIGYLLKYNEKKIYKVIDFDKDSKPILLLKKTKYN